MADCTYADPRCATTDECYCGAEPRPKVVIRPNRAYIGTTGTLNAVYNYEALIRRIRTTQFADPPIPEDAEPTTQEIADLFEDELDGEDEIQF